MISSITVSSVLLDIEGTIASISYVYDILFPYARDHLRGYLNHRWSDAAVQQACDLLARDAGFESARQWFEGVENSEQQMDRVVEEVLRLMDADSKATGLKALQGLIWEEGYKSGKLRSHLFADVPGALERWNAAGKAIHIYSSGSITAQKNFLSHTEFGDISPLIKGYFDTTFGPKREPDSYKTIALKISMEPEKIAFFSDVVAELDAAHQAGMQTILVVRPGNADTASSAYPPIHSFDELEIEAPSAVSN